MTIETKFITGQAVRLTAPSLSAEDFLREIYKPNEQGLPQRTKLESSILLGGVYSAVSGHDAEASGLFG